METRLSGGESGQGWYDLFIAVEVRVEKSKKGGQRQWCEFNALVSTQEGRQWDEVLPKDAEKAKSSSWLHGKEA
jgi:hypothetical protein